MTERTKGRFCANCSKEVVDFTTMTDDELKAYFHQYKGGVCGRFKQTQLAQKENVFSQLSDLSKVFIRAFALIFVLLIGYDVSAQQEEIMGDVQISMPQHHKVKGVVSNYKNKPIPNATILIFKDDILVQTLVTNKDGLYQIDALSGIYKLDISAEHYVKKSIQLHFINNNSNKIQNIRLDKRIERPILGMIKMGKVKIQND